MIDVESELFSTIESAVRVEYPDIFMTSEYVKSPSSFPCVSLVEVDNTTLRNTQSTTGQENHVTVMYELNVYSNKTKGRKAECKEIVAFIDNLLMNRNFTRTMLEPVPNQDSATIYRMLGRYRAIISRDKVVYRR